jgi:hypothetical protein
LCAYRQGDRPAAISERLIEETRRVQTLIKEADPMSSVYR